MNIKKIVLLLTILLAPVFCIAHDDEDDPMLSKKAAIEFCKKSKFKHLNLGTYSIKDIHASAVPGMEKNLRDNKCDFELSEKQIRDYLSKAYIFTNGLFREYTETYPCIVSGEIEQNGKNIKFKINSSTAGFIDADKPNEIKLWCPQCW